MRTYGQFCPLARALDLVGDRWTLLIIRELFARESRYSDLRDSLPGIATNLLADRLRHLEAEGIVESYQAPSPVRATVYRLTTWGRGLRHVLRALVTWGSPLLLEGKGEDAFRTHWLTLALPIIYEGVQVADLAPLTVVVRTGDEPTTLEVRDRGISMKLGEDEVDSAVIVEGDSDDVASMLLGRTEGELPEGLVRGPDDAVERLRTLVSRSPVGAGSSV